MKVKLGAQNFQFPHYLWHTKTQWLLRGHLWGTRPPKRFTHPWLTDYSDYQTKWQNLLYSHMRNVHSTRWRKQRLWWLHFLLAHVPSDQVPKPMTTRCCGCHESTNHRQPSSTWAPELPVRSRSAHAPPSEVVPKFACAKQCGYVAASDSHALDHSCAHKTAVVAF